MPRKNENTLPNSIISPATVVELQIAAEWTEAVPVLAAFRPGEVTYENIGAARDHWLDNGGRLIGIREESKLVSVAALLITPRLLRGLELWIGTLITLPEYRSRGYGRRLMKYCEEFAAANGCNRVILHSGLSREEAHEFYEKCGFRKHGFVFVKEGEYQRIPQYD